MMTVNRTLSNCLWACVFEFAFESIGVMLFDDRVTALSNLCLVLLGEPSALCNLTGPTSRA